MKKTMRWSCVFVLAIAACTRLQAPMQGMTPRRALAAAVLDETIYVTGGWNGEATQLDLVEAFDPATGRWRNAPAMNMARSQHGLVAADGALWAVAGWSAESGLVPQMEMWRPGAQAWRVVTRLLTPRREPGVAMLGRRIVVVGGFNGRDDSDLDGYSAVVEAYDIDTGRWQTLAPLRHPRRGLALLNVYGALFAVGGYDAAEGFMNVVERYDASNDAWQVMDWQLEPRTWAAGVITDDHIVIIGGFNARGQLGLIERVNTRTGTICHPPPLRTPRAWLAAALMNKKIFTFGGETARGFSDAVEWNEVACDSTAR